MVLVFHTHRCCLLFGLITLLSNYAYIIINNCHYSYCITVMNYCYYHDYYHIIIIIVIVVIIMIIIIFIIMTFL